MCTHILQGRASMFATFKNAVLQLEGLTIYEKIKCAKTLITSEDNRRVVFPTAKAIRDIIYPDPAAEDRALARALTALEDYKNLALHQDATEITGRNRLSAESMAGR